MSKAPKSKPAQKQNKKFILVVVGLVAAGAAAVGGLALYRITSSADRNSRLAASKVVAGDAAAAAGDQRAANEQYRDAVDRIGRAVSKEPNQIQYLDQMFEYIGRIQSESASESTEQFRRSVRVMEKRTIASKRDTKVWVEYLTLLRDQASVAREQEAWAMVAEAARNMAERLESSSSGQIDAKYFEADAQVHRDEILTDAEREKAEKQLREVIAARPDHGSALAALLTSDMDDLLRKQHSLSSIDLAAKIAQMNKDVAAAVAAAPESGPVAIASVRALAVRQNLKDLEITDDMARVSVQRLLDTAAKGDGWDLLNSMGLLATVGGKNDMAAGAEILKQYITEHPDALLHMRVLGLIQSKIDRTAAKEVFVKIVETPRLKIGLVGAFQDEIRASAADALFDVAFSDWELGTDETVKTAAITSMKDLRKMIEEITRGRGGEVLLNKIDGKIAFAERDYAKSAAQLGKLLQMDNEQAVEIYLLAAASEMKLGEYGASRVLIDHALEVHLGDMRLILARGDLSFRLGDSEGAIAAADAVLSVDPINQTALRLRELAATPTVLDAPASDGVGDRTRAIIGEAEAQLAQGRPELAMATLKAARDKDPNVRYTKAIVQLLINTGDTAGAVAAVDEALRVFPNDAGLRQQRVMAETADPVERDIKFAELSLTDSNDRLASEYLTLTSQLPNYRARTKDGGTAELRAQAERAVVEALRRLPAARERALAINPPNDAVIEHFYAESEVAHDEAGMTKALELAARAHNPALTSLLKGRSALTKGDYATAASMFDAATKADAAQSSAYRLLGVASERMGDIDGALKAYAEAYSRRPNDPGTVELYGILLGRSGEAGRALEIMRNGARTLPDNVSLVNSWLSLEADVGDRLAAIEFRRRILRQRFADLENTRRFAGLLAETPATWQMLRAPDGRALYTQTEWDALPESKREADLAEKRGANLAEAAEVMRQVLTTNPLDFQSVAVYAAGLFRGGEFGMAEKALRDYLRSAPPEMKARCAFELGSFLCERGRIEEGKQAFAEAAAFQTAGSSDIGLAVADYWFQRSKWAEAEEALLSMATSNPTTSVQQRLAEVKMRLKKFDEAAAFLVQARAGLAGQPSFTCDLLEAGLDQMHGNADWLAGRRPEAVARFAKMDAALASAMAIEPGEPTPHVVRSIQRQGQWARTGDKKSMDEAIVASRRAVELRGSFWASIRTLADQLAMSGDTKGAVGVVQKYVNANPRSWEGRRQLASLLAESGDEAAGLASLEEAFASDSGNPRWLDAVSEYLMSHGKYEAAAAALERAFDLTDETKYLLRAVQTRLQGKPFMPLELIAAIRARGDVLRNNAFLAEAVAAATASIPGSREAGLESLRQLFRNAPNALGGMEGWMLSAQAAFAEDDASGFEEFVRSCAGPNPGSMILAAIAEIHLNSGEKGMQQASVLLNEALGRGLESPSDEARVRLLLGSALFELNDCTGAHEAYSRALEISPDQALVLNNLAYLEATCGSNPAKAIELASQALLLRPGQPEFLDTLGYAYFKAGDLAEAQASLLRALRAAPEAGTWLRLATTQMAAGAKMEAKRSIANARIWNPDDKTAKELAELESSLDKQP